MPVFDYEAFTHRGERRTGSASAPSRAQLGADLKRQGLLLTSAVTCDVTLSSAPSLSSNHRRISLVQFAELTHELSTLTGAGLSISEALKLASERQQSSALSSLLDSVFKAVSQGESVSTAFAESARNVPRILTSMLFAGEARGELAAAMHEAAGHLRRSAELQTKFRSTLIYPFILIALALIAMAIIFVFLVPSLMPLFEGSGAAPPMVLDVSSTLISVVSTHWQVFVLLAVSAALVAVFIARLESVRVLVSRFLLRLPGLGGIWRQRNLTLFARTLGTLLRSNVGMPMALEVSRHVVPSPVIAACIERVREEVIAGHRLSEAISSTGEFTTAFVRFVSIGESSSRLGEMLVYFADLTDTDLENRISRLMSLVAPMLTIAIGLLVGGLILSVLQAILSVNNLAFQ